jgi:hypothetical protein
MPIIGEIPMSKYYTLCLYICILVFFVPECGEIYESLKTTIEEHGGILVDQHECFTY